MMNGCYLMKVKELEDIYTVNHSFKYFADITHLKYYESPSDEFEDLDLFFLCFLFLCGGDGDLSDSELSDDEELEPLDELDEELEELSDDEDALSLVFL